MEPKEYLEKKLEKQSLPEKEVTEFLSIFNKPFQEVAFSKSGEITLEKGDLKINLSYNSLPKELLVEKSKEISKLPRKQQQLIENMDLAAGKYKELKKLTLENQNSFLNITDLVSETKIFFKVIFDKEDSRVSSRFDSRSNGIFLKQNILNPYGIVVLLHEIGHATDPFFLSAEELPKPKGHDEKIYLNEEQLQTILRSERNASSFAINKIRPFIKELDIDEETLNKLIHYPLENYSKRIRAMLAGKHWPAEVE
ncbi:MAG TPA: hypothetical protein VJ103_02045 [Candidatus Paceibacterota bacterium]|nr:hypothetical protein [Candidatus Paceibacterota bacterium]